MSAGDILVSEAAQFMHVKKKNAAVYHHDVMLWSTTAPTIQNAICIHLKDQNIYQKDQQPVIKAVFGFHALCTSTHPSTYHSSA